ncbi:hypothetical protein V5799_020721 [Amblyomma americanum]|uniref:Uncharacterized protein n=1 Tax=Amblyomma americanum TaxID=6943 RepID=A0AAQ4ETM1_AMBAM
MMAKATVFMTMKPMNETYPKTESPPIIPGPTPADENGTQEPVYPKWEYLDSTDKKYLLLAQKAMDVISADGPVYLYVLDVESVMVLNLTSEVICNITYTTVPADCKDVVLMRRDMCTPTTDLANHLCRTMYTMPPTEELYQMLSTSCQDIEPHDSFYRGRAKNE